MEVKSKVQEESIPKELVKQQTDNTNENPNQEEFQLIAIRPTKTARTREVLEGIKAKASDLLAIFRQSFWPPFRP